MPRITPFLWFDSQAEEAAKLYASVFKNSKIQHIELYPKSAEAVSGRPAGSVMTVRYRISSR